MGATGISSAVHPHQCHHLLTCQQQYIAMLPHPKQHKVLTSARCDRARCCLCVQGPNRCCPSSDVKGLPTDRHVQDRPSTRHSCDPSSLQCRCCYCNVETAWWFPHAVHPPTPATAEANCQCRPPLPSIHQTYAQWCSQCDPAEALPQSLISEVH